MTQRNEHADTLKELGTKSGDKLTVYGKLDSNETEGKVYQNFYVNKIEPHTLLKELPVVIGNIEFKTPKEKEFAELIVYNNDKGEGQEKGHKYRAIAFGQTKDKVKAAELKVGDQLKISGDARIYEYQGKKLVDVNLMDFQVSKRKEQVQEAEENKKKSKGMGL